MLRTPTPLQSCLTHNILRQHSYFARLGNAMIWHDLPSALETMIESKRLKDASWAWATIWPDSTDGMDLLEHYTTLAESTKKFDDPFSFLLFVPGNKFIILNAFNSDEFMSCIRKTTFFEKGPAPLLQMLRPFQQQMVTVHPLGKVTHPPRNRLLTACLKKFADFESMAVMTAVFWRILTFEMVLYNSGSNQVDISASESEGWGKETTKPM
ncbi:hypothetical protein K438DRAFT_1772205 [Mycena galopus ATCC 62051]|nr:hypothetical protein K438DRAFT_1772205 [Mycena galopus ATCC 62051]